MCLIKYRLAIRPYHTYEYTCVIVPTRERSINTHKDIAMDTDSYKGPERRNYARIVYKPKMRPRLTVGTKEYEVLDINEGGMRFENLNHETFIERLNGSMTLLNGDVVEIDGKVEWQENGEVGLSFEFLIPSKIIEKEQRHIILNE